MKILTENYVQNHAVNLYCSLFASNQKPDIEQYSLLLSNKYNGMLMKIQTYIFKNYILQL